MKILERSLLVIILICFMNISFSAAQQDMDHFTDMDSVTNIKRKVQEFQTTHEINGSIAVAEDDKNIYANGFGIADQSAGKACTTETQFFIGSVTKQFTAAALLHNLWAKDSSVEALKEALQKPLVNYLPQTDPIWDSSMPEWANRTTLHQLLTHTSGIASFTENLNFENIVGKPISPVDLISMFKIEPLHFEPGAQFEYCNSGYVLLGEVVARLSKKSFSHYLADNFFTPLGMQNTFLPEEGSGKTMKDSGEYPNLARGYICEIEPSSPMMEIEKYWHNTFLGGAGGIVSTVYDLVIWNNGLFNNMVLPQQVTELMLAEHTKVGEEDDCSAFYCYGIKKVKCANGDVYRHDGGIAGFVTTLAYRPRDKLSFSAFTNLSVFNAKIEAVFIEEYKRFEHLLLKPELFKVELYGAVEKKLPGFLSADTRHELIQLKNIVNL